MSKKRNPVVGISIILVLVLAIVGVAYTQWSQQLLLDTQVSTTGLDLHWIIVDDGGGMCTPDPADDAVVQVGIADATIGGPHTCTFRIRNESPFEVVIVDEFVDQHGATWPIADGSNYCLGAPAYTGGELYINFLNGVGTTIASGDELMVAYDICVEDEAQQHFDYLFDYVVVFEQN